MSSLSLFAQQPERSHTRHCGIEQVIPRVRPERIAARWKREITVRTNVLRTWNGWTKSSLDKSDIPVLDPDNNREEQTTVNTTDRNIIVD